MLNLVLNVLLCIFDAKKECKKKSLNKFSLAADLLKLGYYRFSGNSFKEL